MTFAVDLFGVEELFAKLGKRAVGVELAEEAAGVTGVAGGSADLLDLEDHSIFIAVNEDLVDDLDVAGAFALVPQLLAGAGEVDTVTGFQSFVPGLFVDVGEHEDLSGLVILGDGGNQTAAFGKIKFYHMSISFSELFHFQSVNPFFALNPSRE